MLGWSLTHVGVRGQEEDPGKARGLESSLWELEALRRHAAPDVAKMAQIFDDPITRQVR